MFLAPKGLSSGSTDTFCGQGQQNTCPDVKYQIKVQVREENPILYSHKTQLNIKLSLLQHYNNMFRPKLSAIFKFSWSQYPHPLYYTKWERLLGIPNQQPAQARKQLQPANRSHRITHQQTSPIPPQTRSRYIPPTPSTQ